jgi:hypothetical protein
MGQLRTHAPQKRVAETLPAHGADNRMPGNRLIRRRRKRRPVNLKHVLGDIQTDRGNLLPDVIRL